MYGGGKKYFSPVSGISDSSISDNSAYPTEHFRYFGKISYLHHVLKSVISDSIFRSFAMSDMPNTTVITIRKKIMTDMPDNEQFKFLYQKLCIIDDILDIAALRSVKGNEKVGFRFRKQHSLTFSLRLH